MSKKLIYIVIIIFLLATNIATIITTVKLTGRQEEADNSKPVIELPRDRRMGYFNSQVGIRDDQRPLFNDYNRQFNTEAGEISAKMRELRQTMVDEMASENPDTVLLNNIADEFGKLHKEMKILTMEYYFNLKSVSDDYQKERLHMMFRNMLDPEGPIYGRGRGGAGRGMRQGPGWTERNLPEE